VVGAWILEIIETPSADHGAFSFSPTMAILKLKRCGAVDQQEPRSSSLQEQELGPHGLPVRHQQHGLMMVAAVVDDPDQMH
jgi:hypothetical protein